MPQKAHKALKKAARKKGMKGKKAKAYIYGTLDKIKKGKSRRKKR